jgi:hypothetical protein
MTRALRSLVPKNLNIQQNFQATGERRKKLTGMDGDCQDKERKKAKGKS